MVALLLLLISTATGIDRTVDPSLTAIAERRVVEIQTDYSHNGKPSYTAEVLVWNSGYTDPVAEALIQWQASPDHWAILTNRAYTRIGCATAALVEKTYFACELTPGVPGATAAPAPVVPGTPPTVLPDAAERKPMSIDLILLIAAAVCFGLATFGFAARINLVALGLLLWVLTSLLGATVK